MRGDAAGTSACFQNVEEKVLEAADFGGEVPAHHESCWWREDGKGWSRQRQVSKGFRKCHSLEDMQVPASSWIGMSHWIGWVDSQRIQVDLEFGFILGESSGILWHLSEESQNCGGRTRPTCEADMPCIIFVTWVPSAHRSQKRASDPLVSFEQPCGCWESSPWSSGIATSTLNHE